MFVVDDGDVDDVDNVVDDAFDNGVDVDDGVFVVPDIKSELKVSTTKTRGENN